MNRLRSWCSHSNTHVCTCACIIQGGQLRVHMTYGSFFLWHINLSNGLVYYMWPNPCGMTNLHLYPVSAAFSNSSSCMVCCGTFYPPLFFLSFLFFAKQATNKATDSYQNWPQLLETPDAVHISRTLSFCLLFPHWFYVSFLSWVQTTVNHRCSSNGKLIMMGLDSKTFQVMAVVSRYMENSLCPQILSSDSLTRVLLLSELCGQDEVIIT